MGDGSPEYHVRLSAFVRTDLGHLVAARIALDEFDSGECEVQVEDNVYYKRFTRAEVDAIDIYGHQVKGGGSAANSGD